MNESEKSIDLMSSFMYSKQKCRSNQFVTINIFKKAPRKWATSTFYPDKYRNLHNCTLNVVENSTDGSSAAPAEISEAFVRLSNFSISFKSFRTNRTEFNISNVDLMVDPRTLSLDLSLTVAGYPYFIDQWAFFIPPGDLYTPLEKMFLPFQFEVWIACWHFGLQAFASFKS